jgi:hypothetical protein
MQNFQEFAKEQQLESQYPHWTNRQRDEILETRWKDETQTKPTRYVKFAKKEFNKLSDTNMKPIEKMKFVAKKWRTTKYYKQLELETSRVEVEFPGISYSDAFSIAKYRLENKRK